GSTPRGTGVVRTRSPTSPRPSPPCIGPGARTATASSVGRLSMPVAGAPLSGFSRGCARLTVKTLAIPMTITKHAPERRVERTAVELGTLRFVPVGQAIELVGGPVQEYVQSTDVKDGLWVSEIDPGLADTAAFCEHYDIGL